METSQWAKDQASEIWEEIYNQPRDLQLQKLAEKVDYAYDCGVGAGREEIRMEIMGEDL